MKKFFIAAAFMLSMAVVYSCTKNEPVRVDTSETSFIIPVEDAVGGLNSFLEPFFTKSQSTGEIENIAVIYDSENSGDTLLYIVNYANDGGYAVISADRRIKESVLMFSETGNINPDLFRPAATKSSDDFSQEFNDSLEIYKNIYNDIVVGGTQETGQKFVANHLLKYASTAVGNYGEIGKPDDTPHLADGSEPSEWNVPINITYLTEMQVDVMLRTLWDQNEPYNNCVPKDRYAGCVPIAVSQILTYNKYPQYYSLGGVVMDWDAMAEEQNIADGTSEAEMVALLIRHIQVACNSWLFKSGTFTFPRQVEKYLKGLGYVNVQRKLSYDEDKILSSLSSGYPVFLAGAENNSPFNSHAWVVDGWYKSFKHYNMRDERTGQVSGPYTTFHSHYLHCNWGHHNASWVTSGLFREGNSTYNSLYRMITYENPAR